jgi:hypothetical protein
MVVAIVCTGGLALVPLLCACGLSAGLAAGISLTVAGIALVSTAIAFIPNTFDLIAAVDEVIDPSSNGFSGWNNNLHQMEWYNKVQGISNITSAISGGLYSIGSMYNAVKGVSPAELKTFKSQGYTRTEIMDAVRQDSIIKQTLKAMKSGSLSNAQKGNLGEMLQDKVFRENGFKRISTDKIITDLNAPGSHGIDGVYSNGQQYIIGEAKYGSSRLGMPISGKQMDIDWITMRLRKSVDPKVFKDIIIRGYNSVLAQINPKLMYTPRFSRLSFLDKAAKITGTMLEFDYKTSFDLVTAPIREILRNINISIHSPERKGVK